MKIKKTIKRKSRKKDILNYMNKKNGQEQKKKEDKKKCLFFCQFYAEQTKYFCIWF